MNCELQKHFFWVNPLLILSFETSTCGYTFSSLFFFLWTFAIGKGFGNSLGDCGWTTFFWLHLATREWEECRLLKRWSDDWVDKSIHGVIMPACSRVLRNTHRGHLLDTLNIITLHSQRTRTLMIISSEPVHPLWQNTTGGHSHKTQQRFSFWVSL